MSKELEYEFNNFANLLHKDCMNLMECLKKQDKDNKPILYLGKHYQKVILSYEEYQKMCNRLESIDNANPSEALECLEEIRDFRYGKDKLLVCQTQMYDIIQQALIKAEQDRKAIELLKKGFKFEFDENIDIGGLMYIKSSNKKIVVTKHYDKEQLDLLKQVIEVEE